jgi:hypothetical protein
MAKPGWDRIVYRLVLGGYLVLAVSSLLGGQISWDEETDYLGIRDQLSHALGVLSGARPDYHAIHSNLEYYGTTGLLPAWLLWFLQRGLLTGRFSLERALSNPAVEHQLTGFFTLSHGVLLVEMVVLSRVVVALARRMPVRWPWLAGALVLATPTLLGHSFTNSKDVPFALFYSVYTLGLIQRAPAFTAGRPPMRAFLVSLLGATLMVNQKVVAVAPVLISEAVLALLRWRRRGGSPPGEASPGGTLPGRAALLAPVGLLPALALGGALLLQPAAWGVPPWRFLHEAFATFAVHSWGGCMWFDGRCVGVRDPSWSAAGYMLRWLPAKLPLLLILLPLAQGLAWVRQLARRPWRPPGPRQDPALLLGLQLLLMPSLAALRNSNLYDADRHLLFLVPPLAVLAVMGFERLTELPTARPPWRAPRAWALAVVALLAAGQLLDDLFLHPYQLAYFNEIARHRLNHRNTAVDYWAVSAKEAVQQAQLRGRLPTNPTVADAIPTLPLFIGFRQLGGRVAANADTRLLFQVRGPEDFRQPVPPGLVCEKPVEVSRRQLLAPNLVMSRLIVCKAA